MAIHIIPGVMAKIKTMVRDMTAMGSNIFDVRFGDIELISV